MKVVWVIFVRRHDGLISYLEKLKSHDRKSMLILFGLVQTGCTPSIITNMMVVWVILVRHHGLICYILKKGQISQSKINVDPIFGLCTKKAKGSSFRQSQLLSN